MIQRHFSSRLRQLLRHFPIVCILGPRQCGKTTFIKSALPKWQYLDLEKPSDMVRISQDPEDAVARLKSSFILDEAQQLPELFPVLRSFVDANRRKAGQVVLLGSASPSPITRISESLAGRTGFLDLTPFQWYELNGRVKRFGLDTLWLRGGFPDACLQASNSARLDWCEAYTRTFIERDLSALGITVSASQMRKLWTMLAHFHGNIWNASQLAASLGVSYHTVNRYTDILEQAFLLRKLPPYHVNVGKRLVKSPKVFLRDSGLLHYFLGIHEAKTLDVHPARGASWEGFVVEQIVNGFALEVPSAKAFYWRTARGAEVDLLMVNERRAIPFEVKLHTSPRKRDVLGLVSCVKDLGIHSGYVIHAGDKEYSIGEGIVALPVRTLLSDPSTLTKL